MKKKIVLVASVIVKYDAISNIVRNLHTYFKSFENFEVTLITGWCDYSDMRAVILGDAAAMLRHPAFLQADVIIYNFGIYHPLFDACLVGNGHAIQICYFQNITPAEFLPPQHLPVIKKSFTQVHNFRHADRLWAASEYNASTLVELGMDEARIDLMPNAVDDPPLGDLAGKINRPLHLVFVGRAVTSKGLLDAIEAFSQVHRRFPAAILTVASNASQSDPAYLARCRAMISERGLERAVVFELSPDNPRLHALYERAHILLLPTYHEGFCVPVVEALRAGAIPVGYAAGNMPYVVDGLGRLVPPGDTAALSAALLEIAEDLDGLAAGGAIRLDRMQVGLAEFDRFTKQHVAHFMTSRLKKMVVSNVRRLLSERAGAEPIGELVPIEPQAAPPAPAGPDGSGSQLQPLRPEVEVVPDDLMRERSRPSLNRLPDISDWEPGNTLTDIMRSMHQPICIHRKAWEYAICIQGLRQLGVVHENAVALSVGAGSEPPLYYFTNHIKKMVATDLYDNAYHEGTPAMLADPDSFAPFPYRKDRLEVLRMGGDKLDFPDRTFDFIFTLSSIEHFGSREIQRRSVDEMARVLKPGGVACIITEMILSDGSDKEYFRLEEIRDIFLSHPKLQLVGGELDLSISQSHVDYPVDLTGTKFLNKSAHIVLRRDGMRWTSLSMFLQRRADRR
ncbi:hypothetical protein GCM10007301_24440 [Azorhizobium oxalatiphilum]|uniref:Glycosyltransferase n=1 Tax=Azorhizobium oxalatiphilum TaxID=980631 RepID=A0A917C001_9HYPH|nr:glycosyltransferase [Azorhizobium oxalatiphilum]GGF63762.1 hypothetical protein GCM10007301_24440 [Azorhizobium oxalatiphilum]